MVRSSRLTRLVCAVAVAVVVSLLVAAEDPPAPPAKGPRIENFSCYHEQMRLCTFTGKVIDANPAGQTITFGGLTSIENLTTVTDANGEFVKTTQMAVGESGVATAYTTNAAGVKSPEVSCIVNPQP